MALLLPRRKLLKGLAAVAATASLPNSGIAMPFIGGAGTGSSDPIVSLLAQMAAGQMVELTGPNSGSFIAAFPTLPTNSATGCDARYDNTANAIWASDAACASAMVGADSNPLTGANAFSKMGLRAGTSPKAVMLGAGHSDGLFSDIVELDISSACTSILASGPGGTWANLYAGAQFLPQGSANPAWSNFQPGSTTGSTQLVPTSNVNGQHRVTSAHAYGGTLYDPSTGKWIHSGMFAGCGPSGCSPGAPGAAESFDETGSNIAVLADLVGNTTKFGFYMGSQNGGYDICDTDHCVYIWTGSGSVALSFRLVKWSNPTSSPVASAVAVMNNSPNQFANEDAIIFPDPIKGGTARCYFVSDGPTSTTFHLISDITGTPVEFDAGTFSSIPTFNASASVPARSYTRNDGLGKVVSWDGTTHFSAITPNANNPPTGWTWANGALTFTAFGTSALPSAASGDLKRVVYDPVRNCYYCGYASRVWLAKPNANGAI